VCPKCGVIHKRDLKAVRNLMQFATASSAGSHACGDASSGGTDTRLVYELCVAEAGIERCLSPCGING
jgi:hypothetical protein